MIECVHIWFYEQQIYGMVSPEIQQEQLTL